MSDVGFFWFLAEWPIEFAYFSGEAVLNSEGVQGLIRFVGQLSLRSFCLTMAISSAFMYAQSFPVDIY